MGVVLFGGGAVVVVAVVALEVVACFLAKGTALTMHVNMVSTRSDAANRSAIEL